MSIREHHYVSHLSKDKKLKALVLSREPFLLKKRKDVCLSLCGAIMSQQLNTKVADIIHKRFLSLYGDKAPLPQQILDTPFETLRSIGLSNAKANYVNNVARYAIEYGLDDKKLHKMNDDEVIAYLTAIKGVGRWTAEMQLMFTLGREDIFAIDDLGLQQAMIHIYKLYASDKKAFKEKLLNISSKWAPYRTYACLHLWRYKDSK